MLDDFFFNENMCYYDVFMIKINDFKMIKEFTCTNKNIIEIKYKLHMFTK